MGTLVRLTLVHTLHARPMQCCSPVAVASQQIMAAADDPLNPTGTSYSTRILVGRRDDEALEAYARTMVELITKRAPNAGPLLLAISIKEHSSEVFRSVMQQVEENRVW